MAGWHHRLDGLGFGYTLGVGDVQGGVSFPFVLFAKVPLLLRTLVGCYFAFCLHLRLQNNKKGRKKQLGEA